jgi:hypothetical protein
MSRPLKYGPDADANDAKCLMRIFHRVKTDMYRDKKKRLRLVALLEEAMNLMISGKEAA